MIAQPIQWNQVWQRKRARGGMKTQIKIREIRGHLIDAISMDNRAITLTAESLRSGYELVQRAP